MNLIKRKEGRKRKKTDQEVAEWVKAHVTKSNNLGLIPTHIVGENQLS